MSGASPRAFAGPTRSRNGTKSGTRGRKLRSTGTKTAARVGRIRDPSSEVEKKLAEARRELAEAREEQAATSAVLQIISGSPGELQLVFQAILENATRICAAKFGVLWLSEGDVFRTVALHGAPPAFAEARRREPVTRPNPGTTLGRVVATKRPAQVVDIRAEPAFINDPKQFALLELAGARTILNVPMLKGDELLGQVAIYRQEVRPFNDKQIELIGGFAAQAVIAVENARLLNELRQSLQQQTATSEVLRVISSSSGELEPVFKTVLENAVRVCGAKFGNLWLRDGDNFRIASTHGAPSAYCDFLRRVPVVRADPQLTMGQVVQSKQVVEVPDITAISSHGY
jgi:GAF domain